MKNYILILSLFLQLVPAFSQNDSIRKQILNYNNSKSVIISKGRSLLLDKYIEGDLRKTKEIKDYLINEVENNEYAAFYPIEYWLILYWTQEYKELISDINQIDSFKIASFQRKIKPQNDLLFIKVLDNSRESRSFLISSINRSGLNNTNKDFLIMNLDYLLSGKDYPVITQDSLNILADNFLSKYPDSQYAGYTRKYIKYKFNLSKWGFATEFFSGYGIITNNLPETFGNNVSFGFGFDIYYKHFVFYLRDYIGFSKTKQDVLYSGGVWNKGSQVRVFLPEISLGYVLADNKIFKFAPFAGIAATDIGPTQYDLIKEPDLEQVELNFTTTYSFGLNFDFKLGRPKIPMVSSGPEHRYWLIRLRYSYNLIQLDNKNYGLNGNMHYLTIGIGGFGSKLKREY